MIVRPAENPAEPGTRFRIRLPHSFNLMPEDGMTVGDHDMFWLWMLNHGDVERLDPLEPAKEA